MRNRIARWADAPEGKAPMSRQNLSDWAWLLRMLVYLSISVSAALSQARDRDAPARATAALEEKSRAVLRQAIMLAPAWTKVHAAEVLTLFSEDKFIHEQFAILSLDPANVSYPAQQMISL